MSAQLPDPRSGTAHRSGAGDPAPTDDLLRRTLIRLAWAEDPRVTLRWIPESDALVVDVLPLPSRFEVLVHELLVIELDGTDTEALPTRICLTGLTRRPGSPAAARARQLLGGTLWAAARELVDGSSGGGAAEATIVLPAEVLHSRLHSWRRLHGVAIGIDIQPGRIEAVLHGPQADDVIARDLMVLPDMSPDAVVARIGRLVDELRRTWDLEIAGSPVTVGVQVPGPVDTARGIVHHFAKRDRLGSRSWRWEEVRLGERVSSLTGLPVHVVNDVVGYATYDRWRHPAPARQVRAVLLIAQGIGAKLVVGGEIMHWMPMEIGNIVVDPGGRLCDCGSRGCVEATAGTLAIIEQIEELTGTHVADIDQAISMVHTDGPEPDQDVLRILRAAGRALARSIGIVQAVANPSSWAIYGPYGLLSKESVAGEEFLGALHEYDEFVAFKPYQESDIQRRPIEGAEGAEGAALAALEGLDLLGQRPETEPELLAGEPSGAGRAGGA